MTTSTGTYDRDSLLRAGENVIVVHLISQNGLPHFTPGKRYQLEIGEHIIPFADTLQMAVGCSGRSVPAAPISLIALQRSIML